MMKKKIYGRAFCLVGLALVLSSCSPKDNEKIYPYNYSPEQDYYLLKDERVDNFDATKANNIALVRDSQSKFAPAGGMVFTPLFREPASSERERFQRLENVVQILRNDVDVLIPRVFKIAEHQYSEKKVAPESVRMPANVVVSAAGVTGEPIKLAKQTPVAVKKATPVVAISSDIKTVRIADHKDLTRLVLDVTSDTKIKAVISPDGKELVVDISGIKSFAPAAAWNALSGQLVSGYKIIGTDLHIELMYPTKINHQSLLKPNKDSKYYRFVVDLFSDKVHKK